MISTGAERLPHTMSTVLCEHAAKRIGFWAQGLVLNSQHWSCVEVSGKFCITLARSTGGNSLIGQRPLKKSDQKYGGQIGQIIDNLLKDASVISLVFLFAFCLF